MPFDGYKSIWHRLMVMTPSEMWYRFHRNVRARLKKWRWLAPSPPLQMVLLPPARFDEGQEMVTQWRQCRFFPWQSLSAEKIAAAFREQWPDELCATMEAADTICRHTIPIFQRTLPTDEGIPWHFDPVAQKNIPLKYWTDLPYWQPNFIPGVKYIWELNRLQHFVTLAKAYLLTNEEKYVKELKSQWLDWLEKNPPLYGINWTSPLEAALRIISFTWALQMAKHSCEIENQFYEQVLQSIVHHAEFIGDNLSFYSSANNHLLGEALGLIYAGCYYPELKAAERWREKGFAILFEQIPQQVHADGVLKEQSVYYQSYVFDFCLLAKIAADFIGRKLPVAFLQRMEKMAEFIHALVLEPAEVPQIGDGDDGQALRLSERKIDPYTLLLAKAACLFHRGDFKAKAASWNEALFWLFGPAAQTIYRELKPVCHQVKAHKFLEGGYIILRSRENAAPPQRAIFDVGPLGLGAMSSHGHADALSLLLSVKGAPALIDSGTYTYRGARAWRDYFRSTHAHNTVVIDGDSQSKMVGPFQWGRRAHAQLLTCRFTPKQTCLVAQHDGYRHKGIMHTRRVTYDHLAQWSIEDIIEGRGKHAIQQLWHLAPCLYRLFPDGKAIFYFPQFTLTFIVRSPAALQQEIIIGATNPIQGWYSEKFSVKKENPVLCISTTPRLPVHIMTDIYVDLLNP